MAMSYKSRRRLSLLILVVGLPLYVLVAMVVLAGVSAAFRGADGTGSPPILLEFGLYVFFGIAWALPFRAVFRGVGQPDPEAAPPDADPPSGEDQPPK